MEKLTKSENGQWEIEELEKAEILEKPPVSEAQRKAMWAAASGKSKIGIPASVGKEFAEKDPGGELPERVTKEEVAKGGGMGALAGGFKSAFGGTADAPPPPPPPPPPPAPTGGTNGSAMSALAGGFQSVFGKEELKLSANGQWNIEKSDYGPKGMDMYNPKDNIKRKANRTGEVMEDVGQNQAVHEFTSAPMGTAKQQASAEAKALKAKNAKQPVKVYTDEEKKAFQAKLDAEKKV